jgi:hypothetical protein
MQVQVTGKHVDVGEALRSRVADELSTSIGKFFDREGGGADVVTVRHHDDEADDHQPDMKCADFLRVDDARKIHGLGRCHSEPPRRSGVAGAAKPVI